MKTFILSLTLLLCSSFVFAQHRGGGGYSHPAPAFHSSPVYHGPVYRPPVVVRGYYGGYYGFNFGLGYGWYPYSYWGFPIYAGYNVEPTSPCKKEKLKDSEGKKHEVLVCRDPSGEFKVVADADKK
jgi:hypothetical protein